MTKRPAKASAASKALDSVPTSIRLPRAILDEARAIAEAKHWPLSGFLLSLIEDGLKQIRETGSVVIDPSSPSLIPEKPENGSHEPPAPAPETKGKDELLEGVFDD